MNIPNLLTLARLAALPVVIGLMRHGHGLSAATVFFLAMLSDCVDGWIARKLRQESRLGLYLDPAVDKILVIGLFYECGHSGAVSMGVPHLLLAREFLQSGIRTVGALRGRVVGANWMGKTKAVLETPVLTLAIATSCAGIDYTGYINPDLVSFSAWAIVLVAYVFFFVFAWRNRELLAEDHVLAQDAGGFG